MTTRIYLVEHAAEASVEPGHTKHLVEAGSSAQAIRHVVRKKYSAKVPTTKDVAQLMATGHAVETATAE